MSLLSTLQNLQMADANAGSARVVDVAFEIEGESLPADYPRALEAALLGALPWAASDPVLGIHRVRAPQTEAGYVLSRRARLTVRTLESRAAQVADLSGRPLAVGGDSVRIGRATVKPVTPFPTLRAQMVVNVFADEQAFMDDVGIQLEFDGPVTVQAAPAGQPAANDADATA